MCFVSSESSKVEDDSGSVVFYQLYHGKLPISMVSCQQVWKAASKYASMLSACQGVSLLIVASVMG